MAHRGEAAPLEVHEEVARRYHPPLVRRFALLASIVILARCASAPAPVAPPPAAVPPPPVVEEQVIGHVRVTATSLNVRRDPSADAPVLEQATKGTDLAVLASDESWTKVRLATGTVGFVASRFVTSGNVPASHSARKTRAKSGCPADSDYAFVTPPMLSFSDSGAHGIVVVEANVNSSGDVTSTKVVSNSTKDEALAVLTAREIRKAKFAAPIRNCVARAFVFTYRRTY